MKKSCVRSHWQPLRRWHFAFFFFFLKTSDRAQWNDPGCGKTLVDKAAPCPVAVLTLASAHPVSLMYFQHMKDYFSEGQWLSFFLSLSCGLPKTLCRIVLLITLIVVLQRVCFYEQNMVQGCKSGKCLKLKRLLSLFLMVLPLQQFGDITDQ